MSLNRKTNIDGDIFKKLTYNVWDIHTKTIVFSGDRRSVATFLGFADMRSLNAYIKNKGICRKKYAIRVAPEKARLENRAATL